MWLRPHRFEGVRDMETPRMIAGVRLLLTGAAVVAVLAIAIPSWAQTRGGATPRGGVSPGESPAYSTPQPPAAAARPARQAKRTAPRRAAPLTGTTAAQLNQQELARLQAGAPPPPAGPPASGPPGSAPPGAAGAPTRGTYDPYTGGQAQDPQAMRTGGPGQVIPPSR